MRSHFTTVNTRDDDPDRFHTSDKLKEKKVIHIENPNARHMSAERFLCVTAKSAKTRHSGQNQ